MLFSRGREVVEHNVQLRVENAQLRERANQTAERLRDAQDEVERLRQQLDRAGRRLVKLKMVGATAGTMEPPVRPAKIHRSSASDEEIASHRAAEQHYVQNYVEAAVAQGADPDDARDEALRIRSEVVHGMPPL